MSWFHFCRHKWIDIAKIPYYPSDDAQRPYKIMMSQRCEMCGKYRLVRMG